MSWPDLHCTDEASSSNGGSGLYLFHLELHIPLLFIETERNSNKSIKYNCHRQAEAIRINTVEFLLLFLILWVRGSEEIHA